ncbi:MAG: sulfurtransferase complex subunit TusD, partial [Pseudomonadota bacterium]
MKLTIVVHSAPTSQSAWSAYHFTRAALDAGHEIYRLFFYGDGVLNNNALSVAPQGEFDLVQAWRTLIADHGLDAISCVSSALKRG